MMKPLNSALDDHFDDVLQFFTQSTEGAEGVAVRMVTAPGSGNR